MDNEILNEDGKSEKGATLIEYVLLAALIAIVCIVGIRSLGQEGSRAFSRVSSAVAAANT